MQVIEKELLIKGFIVTSYKPKFPEGVKQLSQWIKEVRKQLIYLLLSSEKLIYLDLVNFSIYIYWPEWNLNPRPLNSVQTL